MQYLQNSSSTDNPEIIKLINNVTMFSGVGLIEQRLIAQKSSIQRYAPEHLIFDEGDLGDRLYVIIKGDVQVSKRSASLGFIPVAKLSRGDYFGEVAILRNIPRTARITTITACELLTLNSMDFLNIYQHFPPRARDNIQITMTKRLQELKMF